MKLLWMLRMSVLMSKAEATGPAAHDNTIHRKVIIVCWDIWLNLDVHAGCGSLQ